MSKENPFRVFAVEGVEYKLKIGESIELIQTDKGWVEHKGGEKV